MTLQQLRYIVEISKSGSITAAAKKLFIAQPSLSKVVKDLEEEFHITILKRSRHGISFTTEGLEFLQFAHHVLEASDAMEDYFRKERLDEDLRLSVSSHHYLFAVDGLINLLTNIPEEIPYTIRLREGRTSEIIRDVLVSRSQIGIIYITKRTEQFMSRLLTKNNLEFIPLHEFTPHVYVSSAHPLAGFSEVTTIQLTDYPHVCYDQGSEPKQLSEEFVIPNSISKQTVYVSDRSSMLSIIANTEAYNIGTGCLLPSVVGTEVVSVPIADISATMRVGWIKQKNLPLTPELAKYLHYIQVALNKAVADTHLPTTASAYSTYVQ